MTELSKLPNIGKKLEEQLIQIGINTADEVKADLKEFYHSHKIHVK